LTEERYPSFPQRKGTFLLPFPPGLCTFGCSLLSFPPLEAPTLERNSGRPFLHEADPCPFSPVGSASHHSSPPPVTFGHPKQIFGPFTLPSEGFGCFFLYSGLRLRLGPQPQTVISRSFSCKACTNFLFPFFSSHIRRCFGSPLFLPPWMLMVEKKSSRGFSRRRFCRLPPLRERIDIANLRPFVPRKSF